MAWVQPDFDDSTWDSMDLTVAPGAEGAGWTKRGYAGYAGFAWYRLRINVQGANHRLAIKMPDQADDAYQVYVNGQLIGEFGKFTAHGVTAYPALSEAFSLPRGVGDGTITIAIRMWMDSATRFNSPDAGGLHGPPALGYASLVNDLVRLDYDDMAHYLGSIYLEGLILVMAVLMAATLFWLDRQEPGYLWLAVVCTVTLLYNTILLSVNVVAWIGQTPAVVLRDVILHPSRIALWVLFWGYWFRLPKIGRLQRVVWPLVLLLMMGTAMLRPPLYGQMVPIHYETFISPALLGVKFALGAILFLVAYRGFGTQKTEGWMAASAVVLCLVSNFTSELRLVHIPTMFVVFGIVIQLGTVATKASLLIITVMLLRRFIMAQALKEQWKMEIQQAQEVQQLLIPHELPEVTGISIESEYRPAREVGGDFFQILPLETPGSVLIVVGDVTGKGMQAGMLVALIVGAIRAARTSTAPTPARASFLEVNEQLCERQHRYTYNTVTHTLGSPTIVIDGLMGSNDHNSGRLKVSPVPESDGQYHLYYTIGDQGAGQFNNGFRTNNAQNKDIYEGKVLRLNTEVDGDIDDGAYSPWIPNDNPILNSVSGKVNAVYSYGHRNAQGLVWAHIGSQYILYNSEHGDKSDDEVNVITPGDNYGWPKVAGMCDDNYNDTDANPNNDYLANQLVHNEHSFCQANNVKEPLFSFFNVSGNSIPSSSSSNYTWPTIAPSSIDYYDQVYIPGWTNSLLVTSLKLGMYRLKLKTDGSAVDSSSTAQITDTIPYLHEYRIRDLAIAPTGDTLFLAIDSTGSTSGPTGGFTGSQVATKTPGHILRMVYLQTLSEGPPPPPVPRKETINTTLVFPNPATDHLEVLCRDLLQEPFHVFLYDVQGRIMLSEIYNSSHFIVRLDNIPQGLYIFKMLDGNGVNVTTLKILVLK